MIDKLITFQEANGGLTDWARFASRYNTDNVFKATISSLAKCFLNLQLTTCSSCFFDAYIRLMLLKKEHAMKKLNCDFELRAGALLQGERIELNMTNVNISNELALYHIRRNPNCKKLFRKLPANLDALLNPVVEVVEPEDLTFAVTADFPEPIMVVESETGVTIEPEVVEPAKVAKVPDFTKVTKAPKV